MKVHIDTVGDIVGEDDDARSLTIKPTFYSGNKKSAVGFIKSVDKDGEVVDEIMLQVNDDGKLSVARKRDV